MMLVHFPTALLPMDLCCSVIHHFSGNASFIKASFYAMTGGVAGGWLAALFGIVDLLLVIEKKPDAFRKGLFHGSINTAVILFYTLVLFSKFRLYPGLPPDSLMLIALKTLAVLALLVGNYLGGSLILKNKVAVEGE